MRVRPLRDQFRFAEKKSGSPRTTMNGRKTKRKGQREERSPMKALEKAKSTTKLRKAKESRGKEGKPPIPRSTGAPKPTVKDEIDPDIKN